MRVKTPTHSLGQAFVERTGHGGCSAIPAHEELRVQRSGRVAQEEDEGEDSAGEEIEPGST